VLFSIAAAMKKAGNKVLYFAGYRRPQDLYKQDEVERSSDQIVGAVDVPPAVTARRPQDRAFVGNIVQAFLAYASGQLGPVMFDTKNIDRIIAIGSDRMMAAVKDARHAVMKPFLKEGHVAIGSINSTMQCMMKEICAQCLQRHVDPKTGKESFVFSCFNQDQHMDEVDWSHLNSRLRQGSLQEKLTNLWLEHLLRHPDARDIVRV
jgi:NAD(P)H-flavin reductase